MWRRRIDFELLELLGEGGQGRVYKALRRDRQARLEQFVAVKILHSRISVELWRLEFESLTRVRSTYCVRALSFERIKGQAALVLEYIEGLSLAQLHQQCELEPELVKELLAQLEEALRDLHQYNVVHGDLSPQNIMIDKSGGVRLLDFGLANCGAEELRLTPRFAAPERLQGAPATLATDLYALGCLQEYLRSDGQSGSRDYMHPEPHLRKFHQAAPTAQGRALLAQKVNRILARQAKELTCTTQVHTAATAKREPSRVSWRAVVLALAASCSILATSSASQKPRTPHWATLRVRTLAWHYLLLNGKPLGYAPVDLNLEKGVEYRLEWISAHARGVKALHLTDERAQVLTDSDFLH